VAKVTLNPQREYLPAPLPGHASPRDRPRSKPPAALAAFRDRGMGQRPL